VLGTRAGRRLLNRIAWDGVLSKSWCAECRKTCCLGATPDRFPAVCEKSHTIHASLDTGCGRCAGLGTVERPVHTYEVGWDPADWPAASDSAASGGIVVSAPLRDGLAGEVKASFAYDAGLRLDLPHG